MKYYIENSSVFYQDERTLMCIGNVNFTEETPRELVHWRWNEKTNIYDEVGREPNPNPPQPPGSSELEQLRDNLVGLKQENAALRAEMADKDRENKLALFEIYSMLLTN